MSINDATPQEWDRVTRTGEPTFEEYMKRLNSKYVYDSTEAYKPDANTLYHASEFADCWNRLRKEHPALEPASCNPSLDRAMLEAHKQSLSLETEVDSTFKLPEDAEERKAIPIYTGFIDYFPRAIAAVSHLSLIGGIQHGQTAETLHWNRSKSGDELDAMMRHVIDKDWVQVAWRAMANLEKKLEAESEAEESHKTSTFGAYKEEKN